MDFKLPEPQLPALNSTETKSQRQNLAEASDSETEQSTSSPSQSSPSDRNDAASELGLQGQASVLSFRTG